MGEGRIGHRQFALTHLLIANIYSGLEAKGSCMYLVPMLKHVGRFNEAYPSTYVLYSDFVSCALVGHFGLKRTFENGNWSLAIMGAKFNID